MQQGGFFFIINRLNLIVNTNSVLSDIVQNTLQKQIMTETNSIYVSLPFTNTIILGLWSKIFPLSVNGNISNKQLSYVNFIKWYRVFADIQGIWETILEKYSLKSLRIDIPLLPVTENIKISTWQSKYFVKGSEEL